MYINEQYHDLALTEDIRCRRIAPDGRSEAARPPVLREHVLDVYVNDILTMKLICIPQFLTELVLGRLLTEGIICGIEDVTGVYVCEFGKRAKVFLKNSDAAGSGAYVENTPSCCTGNHILNDYFIHYENVRPVRPIPWEAGWVLQLAEEFKKDTPLHAMTGATHSCYLSQNGSLLFQCEDIGRHNALDKVIGYALRNGIDLTGCIAYTSGRIPTDMAMKAIRAGIPVLAGKAAVTAEAIQLAGEYQLTLVRAGGGGLELYTGQGPREMV